MLEFRTMTNFCHCEGRWDFGLNENGLIDLNTGSLIGRSVGEGFGGVALLEEVCH